MRRKLFYVVVVLIAIGIVFWLILYKPSNKVVAPGQQTTSSFNKQLHAIDEPGSVWWVVNKTRPISPATYAPDDLVVPTIPLRADPGDSEMRLRQEAASALENLIKDADHDQVHLVLASGYHSYQLEVSIYNANVQKYGQAGADKQSPRPGTAESQTGLSADLEPVNQRCELDECFADTDEGQWLAVNAYKYGFIIRYPLGKEVVTGYEYEPWHVRYVGTDLSTELHNQNVSTLEEFFGIVPNKQPY